MSYTDDTLGKYLKIFQSYVQNSQNHTLIYLSSNPLMQFSEFQVANFAEMNDIERIYIYVVLMRSYMSNYTDIHDSEILKFLFDTICLYIGESLEEFLKEFTENALIKIQSTSTIRGLNFWVSFIISESNYNFDTPSFMIEISNKFKAISSLGLKTIRENLSVSNIKEMIELFKALASLNIEVQQESQILAVLIMNSTEYWLLTINYVLNDNEKALLNDWIYLFEDARMLLKNLQVKSLEYFSLRAKKLLGGNNYSGIASFEPQLNTSLNNPKRLYPDNAFQSEEFKINNNK